MIEQPQPGFTGVVWEAREPDRLARELTTGPGAVPMAEAGAAWGRLATSFGAAVVEYEQIVESLRSAWQSQTSGPVLDSISRLRDWLVDATNSATANAARAEIQAAANVTARLAMPNAGDLAALQAMQQTLEQVGAALGAPLRSIAASTDEDADLAQAAAARVMRTYEGATEPLALPWQQDQPPVLTSQEALRAEQAAAAERAGSAAAASARMPIVALPTIPGPTIVPRRQTAYQARVFGETETVETVETVVPQAVPGSTAAQLPVAGPLAPIASGAQEQEYEARGGYAGTEALGADLGIVAAPAVLGAADPQVQGQPVAAEGAA